MKVRIYADGGSRGNPGPSGAGAVVKAFDDGEEGKNLAEISEYIGIATNNQAEYRALILGLQKAKELKADEVDVILDSELLVKQVNGEYRVRNPELGKLFIEVHNLLRAFKRHRFQHILRAGNKEADALVNKAIDAAVL